MDKTIDDIRLEQTSFACPEQYDAYLDGRYVGYLRLRHGVFRVEDADGVVLKVYYPEGDGVFEVDERDRYLKKAKKKLLKAVQTH